MVIYGITSAADTLKFISPNGRYDCIIIKKTLIDSFSTHFINQLAASKAASEYILEDHLIILDKRDSVAVPNLNLHLSNPFVSAHTCFHQRNYSLEFQRINIDSYLVTLTILTDYKLKTETAFTITLQATTLLSKGSTLYKDRASNFHIVAQTSSTLIMEHLFLDNHPCPRTLLFPK